MRRLPSILLLTGVVLIVLVALLVSGLRLVLPHINDWRPTILAKVETLTGVPVEASHLNASWQNFGPTLDVEDVAFSFKEMGSVQIKRVTLALDVWQSLLHGRWQFRDLTFYQLHMRTDVPLQPSSGGEGLPASRITDLFLRQFDHFDLRDSTFSFLTLSGQRAELSIPKLTWLNNINRHRAEGVVSLSSLNGQHGVANVRLDLRDENGLLDSGRIWLQADDIDAKPWFGRWMEQHLDLQNARFSLEGWMNIKGGEVNGGDVWLKKGGASWQDKDQQPHHLSVDNLTANIVRLPAGWQLSIPTTNITIDDKAWPKGSLAFAWLTPSDKKASPELRVRASHMVLGNFDVLVPIIGNFVPKLNDVWQELQPQGDIDLLALDIPLNTPDKTRFFSKWNGVSWKQWGQVPGGEHLSGSLSGSLEHGQLQASMLDARMPYQGVFRAPLEIADAAATLVWKNDDSGFELQGKQLDVKANAVWATGSFRYQQPKEGEPWLGILAGIKTDNGGEAWRYFPENLMGKDLTDYLSGAIKGGQSDNATLLFGGNPREFPFNHNQGQFQVSVPLHNAIFAFQPDWPPLKNLDITLDFINQGLWMKSDSVQLGNVMAYGLTANIPDYSQEQLLIDADIRGEGGAVGPYFKDTPLKDSLSAALDELKLSGEVNARLHLDIPLTGEETTASGKVTLANNQLYISPLNSTLAALGGSFRFQNGDLTSDKLHATWFNQPVSLDFNTKTGEKDYQISVNLEGDWQPAKTGVLPTNIAEAVKGSIPWQSQVNIRLPYAGDALYDVDLSGDLKGVSSHLPSPLAKSSGTALPLNVAVKGDLKAFQLTGNLGPLNHFASKWLLNKTLTLDGALWDGTSKKPVGVPRSKVIQVSLPAIAGEQWLGLLDQKASGISSQRLILPEEIIVTTPALALGGQQWHDLTVAVSPQAAGKKVTATGREVKGYLMMREGAPWLLNLNYLYYNPDFGINGRSKKNGGLLSQSSISFRGLPDVNLRCAECWLLGQKYGRINGDFTVDGDTLKLADGLIDIGFAKLTAQGEWVNKPMEKRTSLKGVLSGKKIEDAANFFDISSPLRGSSFNTQYDLHWRDVPWDPDESTLSGILQTQLGEGSIEDVGTGRAGQLLRLLSFDALLRKLRFDFSDTFGSGFYYDGIKSTAWIKDGILHTDDTLIDGLEADIALRGEVDLPRRQLNMEAIVAPELSTTVSVATAFAVNPIIGAAVFAASKALGPIWSKISILRYSITGPMDKPRVNEVLREPRASETP